MMSQSECSLHVETGPPSDKSYAQVFSKVGCLVTSGTHL